MPPLYDGLSYAEKAHYFWAAVGQGHWFNPLNVEPVIRPPGTVVFSYPLGWTRDFRTYYFNVIYFPIVIFVAALWLIGRPFCRNMADTGVLAALCATLATLPIFYHFEPNPQLSDPINLGQMDAAFAAVAALAAALTIRGAWEQRLSWTVAGIAAGAFSALIKPAGFVVIALLSLVWAVYTASRFCSRRIDRGTAWKYVLRAGTCYAFCYGLFAFWCLSSRYLSRDIVEVAKTAQSTLQSDYGAPHLAELLSTTWALLNIAFGWQGLVLLIAICVAVVWGFLKPDNPTRPILWPGIITSILAILGGGYFWLFIAGSHEIRYFFPFLAVGLTGLFPVLLQLAQSAGKRRLWPLLMVLSLPLPALTGLLLVRHPPMAIERLLRINLTTGSSLAEIQSAHALVQKARAEGRDLHLYLAGDDTIAGIFECVGMYEGLIAPRKKTFITLRPVVWTRPATFHLDELVNSDYVLFTPVLDQPQVSRFLAQAVVADFAQEVLVVRSWLTVAEPSAGLVLESQMPGLRLYSVADSERLRKALTGLVQSHSWREIFNEANASKWLSETTLESMLARSDPALRNIKFADQFELLGIVWHSIKPNLSADLIWKSLRPQKLDYVVFVHNLGSERNIVSQSDYPQDELQRIAQEGALWKDKLTISAAKLQGVTELGIGLCEFQPPHRQLTVYHPNTDSMGHRLIIPLQTRTPASPEERPAAANQRETAGASGAIEGFLDTVNCVSINGWVWDRTRPDEPAQVEIYDGPTLLAKVSADGFREDLRKAGKGNGKHAFGLQWPATLFDGRSHVISAMVQGTKTDLTGSPMVNTCAQR